MRDPMRMFRIVTPGSDDEVRWFTEVIEEISFPLERCLTELHKESDGKVNVEWDPSLNGAQTTGRYYAGANRIEMARGIGEDRTKWTVAHEMGHMVDDTTLTLSQKRKITDLWHEPGQQTYRPVGHMAPDNHSHPDRGHRSEEWATSKNSYGARLNEAFADHFVRIWVPTVWEGHYPRFAHWTDDLDRFATFVLERPMSLPTERIAGGSRYDTSVAISKARFPNGADVVYIATGDNWPDTISAGPIATDGPLLLVPADTPVPQSVLDEVDRLGVLKVVAIGGREAVSEAVLRAVSSTL